MAAKALDFPKAIDMSGFEGITLDVRSPKNLIWKFGLKDERGKNVITWESEFEVPATEGGEWSNITIPFENFEPTHLTRTRMPPQVKIDLRII